MNRTAAGYLAWLERGNTSVHFDAVRAALDDEPRTRRELAERAGVSLNFASTALDVLVRLGEAVEREPRGERRGMWHPAKTYATSLVSGKRLPLTRLVACDSEFLKSNCRSSRQLGIAWSNGTDTLPNLRPIHREPCHREKTAREAAHGRARATERRHADNRATGHPGLRTPSPPGGRNGREVRVPASADFGVVAGAER